MPDILIRGMEMPKSCFYCPIGVEQYFTGSIRCPLLGKGVGYFDEVKNKRDMNCPLVPLPEKHGRLIDADALTKLLNEEEQKAEDEEFYIGVAWYRTLKRLTELAPTIVPAEGGGEDG